MDKLETFKGKIERMSLIRRHCDEYQSLAANVLKHLVGPRVEAVVERFDGASLEMNVETGLVKLSFAPERMPMHIYLAFRVRIDRSRRVIKVQSEYCLNHYGNIYEPNSSITLSLRKPDFKKTKAFVESKILRFLCAYQESQVRDQAALFLTSAGCS